MKVKSQILNDIESKEMKDKLFEHKPFDSNKNSFLYKARFKGCN